MTSTCRSRPRSPRPACTTSCCRPTLIFEEPYATLDPPVRAALEQRGYRFVNQGWNGDIEVIAADAVGTVAVSDPRGRGRARVLGAAAH